VPDAAAVASGVVASRACQVAVGALARAGDQCSRPPERLDAVTDLELVEGTLAGRRQDFEVLVERHQRMLYAVALRYMQNADAADEAVQATFVSAYTNLARFRRAASFKTWLYEILLNHCRSGQRRARTRREVALDDVPEVAGEPGAVERAAERGALERQIARLPARQRSVLSLRVFADLPFKAIARAEGITENAAKVSYHHAIARLRLWLTSEK
jgi:RNA polymerase sigma-70 factor, ECF subfamily